MAIKCVKCCGALREALEKCPLCGGPIEVSIQIAGAELKTAVGRVGTVSDTTSPDGGKQIEYRATSGSSSSAALQIDQISVQVNRPVDVGARGEPRVLACVLARLRNDDHCPSAQPGEDGVGEDGIITIGNERITLQVVAITPRPDFWARVAKNAGQVQASVKEAASWVHETVRAKAGLYASVRQKNFMLLAIDIGHFGVLATPALHDTYIATYGDPTKVYQFGAVWLVGPTENNITKLGDARW